MFRMSVALLAVASLVPATSAQLALPPLGPPLFEHAAWSAVMADIAVADLNSDGHPDWLTAGSADGGLFGDEPWLSVALNNGRMQFAVTKLAMEPFTRELVAGDLDLDGHADVVTLSNGGVPKATLRLGDGLGGLLKVDDSALATSMRTLRLADLDGDGLDEVLAVSGVAAGNLQVLRVELVPGPQLGAAVSFAAGNKPWSYALGDVDSDGDLDAVVSANPNLRVLAGDGAGGFAAPVTLAGTTPATSVIELADANGNGALDALALNEVLGEPGPNLCLFPGDGQGGFGAASTQVPGAQPIALAMADMNSDGYPDALVANATGGDVATFLGGPAGLQFASSTEVVSQILYEPHAVAAADFDGDGKLDVACTLDDNFTQTSLGVSAQHRVVVLRGAGDGTLPVPSHYIAGGNAPRRAGLVDLDGDGVRDLVTATNPGAGTGFWWNKGTGSGAFVSATSVALPATVGLVVQDLDGDGDRDVAAASLSAFGFGLSGVAWLRNAGGAAFAAPVSLATGTVTPTWLAAGDLDGNATADFVMAALQDSVSVLPGSGGGAFGPALPHAAGTAPLQASLADMDADGDLDVVVGSSVAQAISLLRNDGLGGLSAPQGTPVAALDGDSFAVADLDANGAPDVIAVAGLKVAFLANDGTGLLTQPLPPVALGSDPRRIAAGDLDGDAKLDVAALNSHGFFSVGKGNGTGAFTLGGSFGTGMLGNDITLGHANTDGRFDVVVAGGASDVFVHFNVGLKDPWTSLGGGLQGSAGVPLLKGSGPLAADSPIAVTLQAAPSAPVVLVIGLSQALLPFKGGTLVPLPQLVVPGLVTDGSGALALGGTWPPGIPAGTKLLLQAWIADAGALHGFAGSGCEVGVVP